MASTFSGGVPTWIAWADTATATGRLEHETPCFMLKTPWFVIPHASHAHAAQGTSRSGYSAYAAASVLPIHWNLLSSGNQTARNGFPLPCKRVA